MPSRMYDTQSTRTLALVSLTLVEILLRKLHWDGLQDGNAGAEPLLETVRSGSIAELNDLHPTPEDKEDAMRLLEDILLRVVRPSERP